MSRPTIAFLIAPLWVPLIIALYSSFVIFPHPEQRIWVVIGTVISAIFTYFGVRVIGVPSYRILRARRLTSIWISLGVGFAAGALVMLLFLSCFALSLGEGIQGVALGFQSVSKDPVRTFGPPGLLGALVAATLWVIARPDGP